METHDTAAAAGAKVTLVWSAWMYGALSDFPIAKVVLWLSFVYTSMLIYKFLRDEYRARQAKKAASVAFAASLMDTDPSTGGAA